MDVAVCLLCGLPGSGKTTFAKRLYAEAGTTKTALSKQSSYQSGKELAVIYVGYDSIMPSVKHNEATGEISAWKAARTCILKNIETCVLMIRGNDCSLSMRYEKNIIRSELDFIFQSAANALIQNSDIVFVIDDNMHYRGMRHEYYQMCRKYSIGFSVVYFDIALERCLQNNCSRSETVPEQVITKLSSLMEVPGSNPTSKWEKYVCVLSSNDLANLADACQKVLVLIKQSVVDPPLPSLSETSQEELEISRANSRKSFIHQADLCMRKYISSEISSARKNSCDIECVSKQLTSVKSKLLSIMKSGYVDEEEFLDDDGVVDRVKLQKKINNLMRLERM